MVTDRLSITYQVSTYTTPIKDIFMKKRSSAVKHLSLLLLSFTVATVATLSFGNQPLPVTASGAQSYIVVMAAMPLVAYEGDIKGLAATKPAKGKKFNPKSKAAKKYLSHLQTK